MFISCYSYRQASYAPDMTSRGAVGITTSFSSAPMVNSFTSGTWGTQLFIGQTTTQINGVNFTQAVRGVPWGSVSTIGASTLAATSQTFLSFVPGPGLFSTTSTTTKTGTPTSTTTTVNLTVYFAVFSYSVVTQLGLTLFNLRGVTTTGLTSTQSFGTTITYFNSANTTIASAQSSTTRSGATLFSSSSSTAAGSGPLSSAITSTITTTISATLSGVISTTTTSTSFTRWTVTGTSTVTTSASMTTVQTTQVNLTVANATTTTVTATTPVWFGWSSERGTVLIAVSNVLSNDLPAWLDKNTMPAGLVNGVWNYRFTTQTTLWPAQPTGTVGGAATINSSALGNHSSNATFATQTTQTIWGTSSYTTTTTETAYGPFRDSADTQFSTQPIPITTLSKTVTSYSISTSTIAIVFTHNLNTTTTTTSQTTGADIVSIILSNTTIGASFGTLASTVTVTTWISGFTTASVALGIAGGTQLITTTTLTAPQCSITTTTATVQWFYDWSCPTQVLNISTSSAGGSTSTGGGANPSTFKSSSSGNTNGTSSNFTMNVFASPFVIFSANASLQAISNGNQTVFAPAAVQWWVASPTMQGFSPLTNTALTYQIISAPAGLSVLPFFPFEKGRYVGFNADGSPITTTNWGVWGLCPNPVTTTFTYSTTTGTSTITKTGTTVANLSFAASYFSVAGSTTTALLVNFPANGDQALASITESYSTAYTTTTAPGVTVTSTSTGSSTFAGITYSQAVTSTFCESYGYSGTSQISATISVLNTVTFITGVATSNTTTYNYITSTTILSTITFSTLNSSNPTVTNSSPTIQVMPGVGGFPKFTAGAATIYACGAAISLFGGGTSTTSWSSADPNFFAVVVGGNFTTTSSTFITTGGGGGYAQYTIPGQLSLITSPALWLTTGQNKFVNCDTTFTRFWLTPAPFLIPGAIA